MAGRLLLPALTTLMTTSGARSLKPAARIWGLTTTRKSVSRCATGGSKLVGPAVHGSADVGRRCRQRRFRSAANQCTSTQLICTRGSRALGATSSLYARSTSYPVPSNAIIFCRGVWARWGGLLRNLVGSNILFFLGDREITTRASPKSARLEQPMQVVQAICRNSWRPECSHCRADPGVEHPRRKCCYDARFDLT